MGMDLIDMESSWKTPCVGGGRTHKNTPFTGSYWQLVDAGVRRIIFLSGVWPQVGFLCSNWWPHIHENLVLMLSCTVAIGPSDVFKNLEGRGHRTGRKMYWGVQEKVRRENGGWI